MSLPRVLPGAAAAPAVEIKIKPGDQSFSVSELKGGWRLRVCVGGGGLLVWREPLCVRPKLCPPPIYCPPKTHPPRTPTHPHLPMQV